MQRNSTPTALDEILIGLEDPDSEFSQRLYIAYLTCIVAKLKRYQFERDKEVRTFAKENRMVKETLSTLGGGDMWAAGAELAYQDKNDIAKKFSNFWQVFDLKNAAAKYADMAEALLRQHNLDELVDNSLFKYDPNKRDDLLAWGNTIQKRVNMMMTKKSTRSDQERVRASKAKRRDFCSRLMDAGIEANKLLGQDGPGGIKDLLGRNIKAFSYSPMVIFNLPQTFMLMGPPGVGKTTYAKKIGAVITAAGFLLEGRFIQASRSDFIGSYVGETDKKTQSFLVTNVENIIFLDEAYSLTTYKNNPGEEKRQLSEFSEEAVNQLTYFLTELQGRLCFMTAGYEQPMIHDFLGGNVGLSRRFKYKLVLQNYDSDKLVGIYKGFLQMFLPPDIATDSSYKLLTKLIDLFTDDQALGDLIDSVTTVQAGLADELRKDAAFVQEAEIEYELESGDSVTDDHLLAVFKTHVTERLNKLFFEQAGAMEQLANTAGMYLLSRKDSCVKGREKDCFGPCAMFEVVIQYAKESVPLTYEYIDGDGKITVRAALEQLPELKEIEQCMLSLDDLVMEDTQTPRARRSGGSQMTEYRPT